jgi:hypothetical protein
MRIKCAADVRMNSDSTIESIVIRPVANQNEPLPETRAVASTPNSPPLRVRRVVVPRKRRRLQHVASLHSSETDDSMKETESSEEDVESQRARSGEAAAAVPPRHKDGTDVHRFLHAAEVTIDPRG